MISPDRLSALAPGGCDQWAVCRHFHAPALVLFPAIDMEGIHRLVDRLFVPPPETHDLLVALLLAEAREVEVTGAVVLAPDLLAHAGLSDRVDLIPYADHLLLRAPGHP
jgi:DNA-binding transcriptional regulator/RsmH inhibitor MraZ